MLAVGPAVTVSVAVPVLLLLVPVTVWSPATVEEQLLVEQVPPTMLKVVVSGRVTQAVVELVAAG